VRNNVDYLPIDEIEGRVATTLSSSTAGHSDDLSGRKGFAKERAR